MLTVDDTNDVGLDILFLSLSCFERGSADNALDERGVLTGIRVGAGTNNFFGESAALHCTFTVRVGDSFALF